MAIAANELDRAAARAARQVAREGRGEVDKQVDRLLSDVQALIEALREVADAKVASLRSRVESAMAATKAALTSPAQQGLELSDQSVHELPWRLVGGAAASGLLVGLFIGARLQRLTLR